LINDVTFPYWFIRRPEQKYLNTWHGTPLKKLGKHIPGEFMAHCNIQRNLLHVTHLISPNPHTSDVLMGSYDVGGILSAKLAEVGYPRIDRTLRATPERCADIRSELGLDEGKPVVLYAPTWRGEHGHAQFDVDRLRDDVSAMAKLPCQLVFRGHHMVEKLLNGLDLPVVVAGQEIDTSDVLAITDILITDYSSIFFDFLPLKRPILYYAYDEQQYAKQRGLYFDIRTMPGSYCATRESLLEELVRSLAHSTVDDRRYSEALARFGPHEDGKASARTVEFFIEGDDSHIVSRHTDRKRSLLFFNGLFPPNGITSSFLNLASELAAMGKDQITVAIEPERIVNEPIWLEKLRQMPAEAKFIGRVGHMIQSPEECWVGDRYAARRDLDAAPLWDVLRGTYEREFRRVLGDGIFDSIINFEGYSAFWTTLLGLGAQGRRNVSYLHNDMVEEFRTKHPYLRAIFSAYRYYDRLVSVSRHMSDVNRRKLVSQFGLEASTFVSCSNSLDVEQIRKRAREPLDEDLQAWMNSNRCFLSIGRMSPEKGHAKLISAFARVHAHRPDVRLIIMGDGPLRDVLKIQIAESGLEDAVFLAGLRQNPFPALAKCACFILASNHEGQPMVLLEAMTLGRPIIATDIDGNRGVLGVEYGMLAENSVEGLESGILRFLDEGRTNLKFDAETYNKHAITSFFQIVDGEQSDASPGVGRTHRFGTLSNRIVVAARSDGLGERMNAILNGMYLAKRLGFDFAYYWSPSGTWEKVGADRAHHAIVNEKDFFSEDFIARYSVDDFSRKGFVEVSGRDLTEEYLVNRTGDPGFSGWLAPRLDLKDLLAEQLRPNAEFNLGSVFHQIGFHSNIAEAIRAAESLNLPSSCVAFHLRSGDIFYGPYRKYVHYSYKGVTLPVAKAIIFQITQAGGHVLLFGQDKEVMQYLKREVGATLLEDIGAPVFASPAAQAMFEIVLMSRFEQIVAGSSGFAKQASWIGGSIMKHPADFFDHFEQTRLSVEDLRENANTYHPLQTAFAYWYAYFYGRQFKTFAQADQLLAKAYEYDPENQLYPIKRAANCFRAGKFEDGNAILEGLITSEYIKSQSARLPLFDVLVAKTLGNFNLSEDFDSIALAVKEGQPYAAVCDYVIRQAKKEGGKEALQLLRAQCLNDAVLWALYRSWAKPDDGKTELTATRSASGSIDALRITGGEK
jgi:glycosyltransferase involved in cell wall biosynthesis